VFQKKNTHFVFDLLKLEVPFYFPDEGEFFDK